MPSTSLVFIVIVIFVHLALADLHHLFVGNLAVPASLHVLEFDDEALTLNKTETIKADSPHAWIAFDNAKNNIYGVSLSAKRVASYSIHWNLNSTLRLDRVIDFQGNCFNKTSAFVLQSPRAPFAVYISQWPGPNACGMAASVLGNGTLSDVIQTWKYANKSGVHGLALGPGAANLYSADLSGDAVWTHTVGDDGKVSEVATYTMPRVGTHPRHLAAHPGGAYLYVVTEAGNALVAYSLDSDTATPVRDTATYSLIPEGSNTSNYWSVEPMLSQGNRYLWATARAEAKTNLTGWISLFQLDDDGAIQKQLFMVPTTTENGIANAVSPAPFSDEWMALADNPTGYVQIWRLKAQNNGTTAVPVARVDIKDGGCCANAIWYD